SELQYITQMPNDTISQILIDLKDPKESGKMKLLFEEKYNVSAFVPDDYLKIVCRFTNVFEGFANMVIVITTAVALMFISTIMVISVREMQSEIGVLRAMGLSKFTVFKSILAESLLMCISGYGLGVLFGFLGAKLLNWYIKTTEEYVPVDFQVTIITPSVIIYAALFALVMGCISGMIPAFWATRLNITQVLKEG
ncbi:MAG: FtsX-like permease family protein, partial [Thermoplasmata archaeon]